MAPAIEIIETNIVTLDVDAIVNAANSSLLGGGGVDGAIHRAAGRELLTECRALNGCRPGEAKMTKGYQLKARHVIHTVGPVWNGGTSGEPSILEACYRNSMQLAAQHKFNSIAFPAISTGVYRYPLEFAAAVAVKTVSVFLEEKSLSMRVIFCTFDVIATTCFQRALEEYRE